MGTSVDNIEVDPTTGDLWIGCHPLGYAIMDFFDIFGFPRPSQVGFMIFNIKVKTALCICMVTPNSYIRSATVQTVPLLHASSCVCFVQALASSMCSYT